MANIKKILEKLDESSTVSGVVAGISTPLFSGANKRVAEGEPSKPEVIEYGNWENSALTTSNELKKARSKSAKVTKSIYGVNEGDIRSMSTPLKDIQDWKSRCKALQDIQMDPETKLGTRLSAEVIRTKSMLDKEARARGWLKEDTGNKKALIKKLKSLDPKLETNYLELATTEELKDMLHSLTTKKTASGGGVNRSKGSMTVAEAVDKCPPATQDIKLNLENRQKAIDEYGYGPLNPDLPNTKFWLKKVDEWNLDSASEAKQSLCGNCAAFDVRQETLDCIAKGIDSENSQDAEGVIDAGELGYCKFLKFKCASRRTCDAWVTGGPLTDSGKSGQKDMAEMDNRTRSGDRREQRANSPEAIAQRELELQADLKKVSPKLRKKLGLPEPKKGVAEADKHSFVGKIQRGHELKKKVDSTFKDIGAAQQQGDKEAGSKAFRKHERYANLERPGTWTKVKDEGVAEGSEDDLDKLDRLINRTDDNLSRRGDPARYDDVEVDERAKIIYWVTQETTSAQSQEFAIRFAKILKNNGYNGWTVKVVRTDFWNGKRSPWKVAKTEQGVAEGTEEKTPEYYIALAKKHTADGQKGTRANMVYASKMAGRARRAAEMLKKGGSQEDAWRHYQGTDKGMDEGINEMDKSAPQPGRDGRVSHSTYGSRDKKGSDYFKGKEAPGKAVTAKQAAKDALDILKKQGVAEGQQDVDESNAFTNARMNAIKAGKKIFKVGGKTYKVTGDIKDELEAGTTEGIGEARLSAAARLQRAFDGERSKSAESRRRGEEILAKAREEWDKKHASEKNKDQGVAEGFGTDPTQQGTWHGHKIIANRKTPKGSFLIIQNKNDGKYEIHKHNPGVVGGLEFVSVHKTPEEMQAAFRQLTGVDESQQGVAEGALDDILQKIKNAGNRPPEPEEGMRLGRVPDGWNLKSWGDDVRDQWIEEFKKASNQLVSAKEKNDKAMVEKWSKRIRDIKKYLTHIRDVDADSVLAGKVIAETFYKNDDGSIDVVNHKKQDPAEKSSRSPTDPILLVKQGDIRVVSAQRDDDGALINVYKGRELIAKGIYDYFADSFFFGQDHFDTTAEIAAFFAKKTAKPDERNVSEADLIINPGRMGDYGFVKKSHPDHEIEMAKSDLYQATKNALAAYQLVKDKSEEEGLEGWVQEKITKAEDYLSTVADYLASKQLESIDGVGQSTKMFTSEGKPGLWDNIRKRRASGKRMRKPGEEGAPSDEALRQARKGSNESAGGRTVCPECGGAAYSSSVLSELKDACYHKVKSRYKIWPSAYASGALVKCRKVGAKNWGKKG